MAQEKEIEQEIFCLLCLSSHLYLVFYICVLVKCIYSNFSMIDHVFLQGDICRPFFHLDTFFCNPKAFDLAGNFKDLIYLHNFNAWKFVIF